MSIRKKICIVTGGRAEYGLFHPLITAIGNDGTFKLQLAVTGMHLSAKFGNTYKEISNDGVSIDAKIPIGLGDDSPLGILKSMSQALAGLGRAFTKLRPDYVLLLGDRFETFCAAAAAHVNRIPLIHLHGGELSEGVIDDAFRHAVTKMSQLHFASTDEYRKRIIQLGEDPRHVYTVGAIGLDNINETQQLNARELAADLGFVVDENTVIVTFHPATLERTAAGRQFGELLQALEKIPRLKVLFTRPNADTGGQAIIKMIDSFVKRHRDRAVSYVSLGRIRYLAAVSAAGAVAGNSSSGIIEVPSLGKPTINIGDRQKGRIMANSIINCPPEALALERALRKAFSPSFRELAKKVRNPYGNGKTALRILTIMKKELPGLQIKKHFHDL